jgi:hypothetical protein
MTTGKLSKILDSAKVSRETIRNYIGASSIGSSCVRQIWYGYKGVSGEPITPRLYRTFEVGHKLEKMVVELLLEAGVIIERGRTELQAQEMRFFRGHVDAVILDNHLNDEAILEIKTAKDSSFKQFVNKGLLSWSPMYYAQVQAYMGMMSIHKAYVLCINKDTSELHDEEVLFDASFYDGLKFKAQIIHDADEPPPRVNNSPAYFVCKQCKFRKVCHD